MKVRIKFSKYSVVKFIGHLDVMRYFQKAVRRAQIDVKYSEGFNPHQIMSFAAPLGVGLTSDGEYVDIEINSMESKEEMIAKLNEQMNEGFEITGFEVLQDTLPNQKRETAMSLVTAADYLVSLKDHYTVGNLTKEEFEVKFKEFISQETIIINKKTKKSEREMDIKPFIFDYSFEVAQEKQPSILHADIYESGIRVFMQLATGSVINIKPELVLEAFYCFLGLEYNQFAWQMHRMETYGNVASTGMTQIEMIEAVKEGKPIERTLVPLGFIGI